MKRKMIHIYREHRGKVSLLSKTKKDMVISNVLQHTSLMSCNTLPYAFQYLER